jgi:hypothetical protein
MDYPYRYCRRTLPRASSFSHAEHFRSKANDL